MRYRAVVAAGLTMALAGFGLVGALVPGAAQAAPAHAAAAAGPPITIGVDNTPPPGRNWEYTHYFPESDVNVPQGSLVLFSFNAGSINGIHTVTFVPNGSTEAAVRAADPTVVRDTTGEGDDYIPARTNNPTSFTCGTSPAAPPCTFDGTSIVSSGIIPSSTGAVFPVQIAANTAPGTYHYICLVHPGMSGTINVVPSYQPASSPAEIAGQAAAELAQLNAGAFAAERAASVPQWTINADGTRTWTVHVGVTADDVDLLEFLPQVVPINKGDSVTFDASLTTQEPHTVTSPGGIKAGFGAIGTNYCEVQGGPDVPAQNVNGPPELGCKDPSTLEQPINLGLQGEPNVISSGFTATSDVREREDRHPGPRWRRQPHLQVHEPRDLRRSSARSTPTCSERSSRPGTA